MIKLWSLFVAKGGGEASEKHRKRVRWTRELGNSDFFKTKVRITFPDGKFFIGKWISSKTIQDDLFIYLYDPGPGWVGPVPPGTRIKRAD